MLSMENNKVNIKNIILDVGGILIYSYQEHLIKPNPDIYNLLIDRFKLNKEETIFFDDKKKRILLLHVR